MKRAIIAALATAAVITGIAGAQGGTKNVTRLCVHVEQQTSYPSYGDLNLYRGTKRVCLVGKPGKNGKNGKAGAKGAAGQDGAPGAAGAKGDTGAAGATGAQGAQGEQGPAGAQGATGPAGPTGAAGPQGEPGQTGATGPAGPAGDPGPAGPTGPQGPAGQNGLGDGTVYLCYNAQSGSTGFIVTDPANCNGGHSEYLEIVIVQH